MGEINIVLISGTVLHAPEFSQPKTYELAKFTITHKKDPSKDFVSYHEIRAWAKTVEKVRSYAQQGSHVLIQGRIDKEAVEPQKTGQKTYYKEVIVANDIQPMESNQEPQAPKQQPDFMQSPQGNPPPQHQLPPKREYQSPDIGEGKLILNSERDFANTKKEPAPPVAANANAGWNPPVNGEPPF